MRKSRVLALTTALLAVAGCFDEPEPAYKSIPAERRVYLSDKGLSDLAKVDAAVLHPASGPIDYLNLDRNQLTNVDAVASLTGLKWLRLNGNRLAALPDLKSLVNLRRIYLKGNRFTAVPETLKDLPALTDVDLSGNPISDVPDWLAAKKGLENLSFANTRVTKLPADLTAWKGLRTLQLGGLSLPPAEMTRVRAALTHTAVVY